MEVLPVTLGSLVKWWGSFAVVILLASPILAENVTSELTQEETPTLATSLEVIKFVELLGLHERNHEAQFILQVLHESQDMFVNARSIEVIQPISNKSSGNSIAKLKVTIGCHMVYTLYPFDTHLCSMALMSPDGGAMISPHFCGDLTAYEFHVKGYLVMPLATPVGNPKMNISLSGSDGGAANRTQVIHFLVERTSTMQIFSQMYSPILTLTSVSFLTVMDTLSFPIRIASSLSMFLISLVVTSIIWTDIPRAGDGEVTVLEHYFELCVGFLFQVFFNNILLYWYSALRLKATTTKKKGDDIESKDCRSGDTLSIATTIAADEIDTKSTPFAVNGVITNASASDKPSGLDSEEDEETQFIKKLGKWHSFLFFKCLKPGKKHLPIAFLIINVIYWIFVLYVSSGLPKGFQDLPATSHDITPTGLCL